MVVFVGIDLAWTAKNDTGVCLIEHDGTRARLIALEAFVAAPCEFAAMLDACSDDVIAAIDAPLIVTPERVAERQLARVFGRHGASAYNANRTFLEKFGGLAGPNLATLLQAADWSLDPAGVIRPRQPGRYAFEVYPHATHVSAFARERILKYKKGALASRRVALGEYQRELRTLVGAWLPALVADVDGFLRSQLDVPGLDLKHLEDRMDALTCALVAYHIWERGPAGMILFGDPENGHIVVPASDRFPARGFAPDAESATSPEPPPSAPLP